MDERRGTHLSSYDRSGFCEEYYSFPKCGCKSLFSVGMLLLILSVSYILKLFLFQRSCVRFAFIFMTVCCKLNETQSYKYICTPYCINLSLNIKAVGLASPK